MSVDAIAAVTVQCRQCGGPIATRAKPGNTIRCPACHHPQRNRLPGRAILRRPGGAALTWDPPSQPRGPYLTAEPCPDCAAMLWATPGGTRRACLQCHHRVTPAAVAAPYARGAATSQRQVVSQRERDLAAIGVARRQGVMLAQLGRLADDDRLHPESRPVVDWFAAQVKTATSDARLSELAALLPEAGIRRRGWWQGQPAAIDAPTWDDEDDYDDAEDQDDDSQPPAAEATPGRPGELTPADAMDACGWQLTPTVGGCQVVEAGQLCGAETRHEVPGRYVRRAWVCTRHYYALCKIIKDAARSA